MNANISANARLFLINTTIHIIFLLYNEYIKLFPSNVQMKNTVGNEIARKIYPALNNDPRIMKGRPPVTVL